ncbi:MAG: methane monooxygenase/ammonia monooxygenase subunit B [Actinomycetota bacterium]
MRRVFQFLLLLMTALAGTVTALAGPASAHGENAQEAFIKTGAVAWSDVKWSTNKIQRGESVTMTGRMTLLTNWPGKIAKPENTEEYLNVNAPGPVFVVTDRRVGGEFVPGRMKMERGKTYDFKLTVVGRKEGRWHLHPMLQFKTVGPIIGPGQWVRVEGGPTYRNEVELANGKVVNLESYGRSTVLSWHLIALLPAVVWLVYWLVPRPLLYRAKLLATGENVEEELVGPRERRFGVYTAVGIAVILGSGMLWAKNAYPETVPQQIRRHNPPALDLPKTLAVENTDLIRYSPTEEKVTWKLKVTNNGQQPASIREFTTSTVTFGVPGSGQEYSLVVPDDAPINPGETRELTLVMADSVWGHHGLISLHEVQSSLSGLLIFEDPTGAREGVEMWGELTRAR